MDVRASPIFQSHPVPGSTLSARAKIKLPLGICPADSWRYLAGLRDTSTSRKTINSLAFSYVIGLLFNYSTGVILTMSLIGKGQPKLVSEVDMAILAFVYAVFTIALTIATDTLWPHLSWTMKWAAAQKSDLPLKDLRRILRSDSTLPACKSLLVGPMRARLAALFYFVLRFSPILGFSLVFGAYKLRCNNEGDSYPWRFRVQSKPGLLAGGGALAVGLPLVCSIVLRLYLRKTDSVPRSILAVAVSLSRIIQPLQQCGTMATTRTIVKKLGTIQRFRAIRADMNGQFVLEFAPCEPPVQQSSDAATAVDLSMEHRGSFLASHVKRLAPPVTTSLLLAIGIQVWLQTVNIRGPEDANVCLPIDQIFGHPNARIGLSILVTAYSIATGAAFEQIMHIYRWSAVHMNPVDIIQLENLFQGHFFWPYWHFRHLPALGGRAFTTGLLGTIVSRLCIGFVPPLALLTGWDSGARSSTYRDAISALTWIAFSVMVVSGIVVLASTWEIYVPDDDPIITAVVLQDLVTLFRETKGTIATDAMKMGSVHINEVGATAGEDSLWRVSFRQQTGVFRVGRYV